MFPQLIIYIYCQNNDNLEISISGTLVAYNNSPITAIMDFIHNKIISDNLNGKMFLRKLMIFFFKPNFSYSLVINKYLINNSITLIKVII